MTLEKSNQRVNIIGNFNMLCKYCFINHQLTIMHTHFIKNPITYFIMLVDHGLKTIPIDHQIERDWGHRVTPSSCIVLKLVVNSV